MQSRRHFIRGLAGVSALAVSGCCSVSPIDAGSDKIRLAVVGIGERDSSSWLPMVRSGLAEVVAFCDADATRLATALAKAAAELPDIDLTGVPFYSDAQRLLDDCDDLGVAAMTIATPDHLHAPIAIGAMKRGIHVYVEAPLAHTLGELDSFSRTAKECGVIVQMGDRGSALDPLRRAVEVLRSGLLGDVGEVHVWTDEGVRDWRGSVDLGTGVFGASGADLMNLPFRGLELGTVTDAECTMIEGSSDSRYPRKSIVQLTFAARVAKFGGNRGRKLPAVTLVWYDGGEKPSAELMPKLASVRGGAVPSSGAYILGTKGALLVGDAVGTKVALALAVDKAFVDISRHEAAKAVGEEIAKIGDLGHGVEFLRAIKGEGVVYEETHARCFSDLEHAAALTEGLLVGCIAQRIPDTRLVWNSRARKFDDDAANALVKPDPGREL